MHSRPHRHRRTFDDGGPTLAEVGEAALLSDLRSLAETTTTPEVLLGSGDDGAVWCPPPGRQLVVSQDALVELQDFRREWIDPWQLGRRAFAVAVSDLAAMGADPAYCLVTVCAGSATCRDDVIAIDAGVCDAARDVGCAVVGGDVSATSGPMVVDISVGGTVAAGCALRRDRGREGDLLVVTGSLGRAAAGLRLLQGDRLGGSLPEAPEWRQAQLDPRPRLEEGRRLAASGVRCAGDVSDGLLADAERTAAAGGVGAELWRASLPVGDSLRHAFPGWLDLALGGGEDFELLWAAASPLVTKVMAGWPGHLAPLTVVGRLVGGGGVRLLDHEGGEGLAPPAVVARHFTPLP